MSKFQYNDKVICVKNTPEVTEGWVGWISANEAGRYPYIAVNESGVYAFREDELELLERAKNQDHVTVGVDSGHLRAHQEGDFLTIKEAYSDWCFNKLNYGQIYKVAKSDDYYIYQLEDQNGDHIFVKMDQIYFERVPIPTSHDVESTSVDESIFDSSLDKRKNGKNQMELVETGFPNALLMLGEVMTWAGQFKGYAPNDWKEVPDPVNAFLGAASRHRLKRLSGVSNDEESDLPHLAHEAFNVLAQLELLLTGKLK